MDLSASKKRRTDENVSAAVASTQPSLTIEDAKKIISFFSREQLQSIIANSILDPSSVLPSVRAIADKDPTQRKLFIRGIGLGTTTESLRSLFSSFGELEEALVACEESTGKPKDYGFVTFRHIDGAILALQEPRKKIDGRTIVTQLAGFGNTGAGNAGAGPAVVRPASADVGLRKVIVENVPRNMPSNRLLQLFSSFGEIEEGPLGMNESVKFGGNMLFVYKTVEAARAATEEPMKIVDGHHMIVKLAIDGKKKPGMGGNSFVVENKAQNGVFAGFETRNSIPVSVGNQYGAAAAAGGGGSGMGLYGIGSGGHHHLNSPLQSSIGLGLSGRASNSIDGSMGLTAVSGIGGYGSGGGFGRAKTTLMEEARGLSTITYGDAPAAAAGGSGMGFYGFSSGGHRHLNSPLQSSTGLGLSRQASSSMGLMAASGIGGYGSGGGFGDAKTKARDLSTITFGDVAGGGGGRGMGLYGSGSGGHHQLNSPLQSSIGLGLSRQALNSIGGSMAMSGIGGYGSGGGFGDVKTTAIEEYQDLSFEELSRKLMKSQASDGSIKRKGVALKVRSASETSEELSEDEIALLSNKFCRYLRKKGFLKKGSKNRKDRKEEDFIQLCYRCKESGHIRKNCPLGNKYEMDSDEEDSIKCCYKCNKVGHIKRNCPLRKDSSSKQKDDEGDDVEL